MGAQGVNPLCGACPIRWWGAPLTTVIRSQGELPARVKDSLRFLREQNIWHLASRNPPVTSCAQAARQRHRLGYIGIPICDELKSLLYSYEDAGGSPRYALLHCRGHQRIDLDKVAAALGSAAVPVPADELQSKFGAEYGTVTPVLLGMHPSVRQIVDDTVLARFFPPHTMMTNCGDLQHGVEFRAAELFRAIPDTIVLDIVAEEDKRVPRETFGILTGNSPESGILLWEKINHLIRSDARVHFRGDTGFPRVLVDSVPGLGASMELPERESDVRPMVIDAISGLCRAGATTIGVACNTTQYFASEIRAVCTQFGSRFISIAEETGAYLRQTQITEFDLLGIKSVSDLDRWSDFGPMLRSFDVHVPDPPAVAAISELAFRVKREVITPAAVNRLRDLINRSTETDTVVVALTELSILLSRQHGKPRSGKRFIDTLDVLAGSMAEIHLEERTATGGA